MSKLVALVGLVIFGISGALYVSFDSVLDEVLEWQNQLKDGNLLTYLWEELPFPLHIKVYVFEILNGQQFKNGYELAHIREIGPFVFKQKRTRIFQEWSSDNSYVRVMERLRFDFDEERSVSTLNRRIRAVNAPVFLIMGFVVSKVKDFYLTMFTPLVRNVLYPIFKFYDDEIIRIQTIDEILYGREVGILQIVDGILEPLKSIGIEIPLAVGHYKLGKVFGFIDLRHNKTFGPMEYYTGQTSRGKFNHVRTLDGKSRLNIFRSACNRIQGTEGTLWGPKPPGREGGSMWMFNPHLCKPIEMIYERNSTVMNAFTYRFRMDANQFKLRERPENWCYCPKDESRKRCEGVFFMNPCLSGAPMAMSNPHFYGSPSLLKRVHGLAPDYEKHIGFLEVERTLGATVEIGIRLQLNLDMKRTRDLKALRYFPSTIMPYLWFEEGARISGWVKGLIVLGSNTFEYIDYILALVGAFGLLLLLLGTMRTLTRKQATSNKNQNANSNNGNNTTK